MSTETGKSPRTILKIADPLQDPIELWFEVFLRAKRVERLSPRTIEWYQEKLSKFAKYADAQAIISIEQLTAQSIRDYMQWLEDKEHNPGGIHGYYRSLKAFLRWFQFENDLDGWANPIRKVKAPKVNLPPLPPADIEDIQKMLRTCREKGFLDFRDFALLLFMLDTGMRISELIEIRVEDIDMFTREVQVRKGNGGKSRVVYMGRKTSRHLRKYVRYLKTTEELWQTQSGDALSVPGLRSIIKKRASMAKIKAPSPQSFRRAFAIEFLRSGGNVYVLKRLMGHSGLSVLQRYLDIVQADLAKGHGEWGNLEKTPGHFSLVISD